MKVKSTAQILTQLLLEDAPQKKKAEFLSTYLKLIVNEGFAAATLTRIAKEHKTSKALVHYYLPNFDDSCLEIFLLCARHGAQFTHSFIEKEKEPREKLLALLRAPFYWTFEHLDLAGFVLVMYQKSSIDKKLRAVHLKNLEEGRKRLSTIFQAVLQLRPDEAEKKALLIHSQMIATLFLMNSTAELNRNSVFLSNYEYLVEEILKIKMKVFP